MPKPLTLLRTRPLLSSLFRKDKLTLRALPRPSVFFNSEPIARFSGQTWEEVLESAQLDRFKTKQNENN